METASCPYQEWDFCLIRYCGFFHLKSCYLVDQAHGRKRFQKCQEAREDCLSRLWRFTMPQLRQTKVFLVVEHILDWMLCLHHLRHTELLERFWLRSKRSWRKCWLRNWRKQRKSKHFLMTINCKQAQWIFFFPWTHYNLFVVLKKKILCATGRVVYINWDSTQQLSKPSSIYYSALELTSIFDKQRNWTRALLLCRIPIKYD